MGKASRNKRERSKQPAAPTRKAGAGGGGGDQRRLPVFWIVVGGLVVAGIAALVLTAPERDTKADDRANDAPVYADVEVTGATLPDWSGAASDSAVGRTVPTISGVGFDEVKRTIPVADTPTVVVVVAHWCPHCNREVPRIVEWARDADTEGISIIALSSAADKGQPNYPPAVWLEEESWPFKTFVDDEASTAGSALGASGYPFLVFIDSEGKVTERYSGEMPIDEFDKAVDKLRGS